MILHRRLRLVLSCLALAALGACSSRPDIDPASAPAVSAMARALMQSNGPAATVQHSAWPAGIQELLDPQEIRIRPEGVYIVTSSFFVMEDGVFVPRDAAKFDPGAGGDPSYTRVALDLFTYHVAG